jgi:hypothetical protein
VLAEKAPDSQNDDKFKSGIFAKAQPLPIPHYQIGLFDFCKRECHSRDRDVMHSLTTVNRSVFERESVGEGRFTAPQARSPEKQFPISDMTYEFDALAVRGPVTGGRL